MKYKVEVIADSSGKWCGNELRFDTSDEAQDYAEKLAHRWYLVTAWRVVDETGYVVVELES